MNWGKMLMVFLFFIFLTMEILKIQTLIAFSYQLISQWWWIRVEPTLQQQKLSSHSEHLRVPLLRVLSCFPETILHQCLHHKNNSHPTMGTLDLSGSQSPLEECQWQEECITCILFCRVKGIPSFFSFKPMIVNCPKPRRKISRMKIFMRQLK